MARAGLSEQTHTYHQQMETTKMKPLSQRLKRGGTQIYLWLIHVDVWHKPTQDCKAIILQFKK